MRYDYMIVDVFTDTAFGGNQLAVLSDARGISSEGMQAITREFDFPETTFLLPPSDPAYARRVRIFTPGRELPFAGHPTVGTACALAMAGACAPGEIILEEGVGPVPVAVTQDGASFSGRFRVDHGPEVPDGAPSADEMAAILSVEPGDVRDVFAAGLGVNFTYVQLNDRETVDSAVLDHAVWSRVLADAWGSQMYLFAGELTDGGEIYSRMFGPKFGIPEDPATGSAAAAIAGVAGQRGGSLSFDIRQGVKMGRPSLIRTSVEADGGEVRSVHVGGGCVFVADGQIEVPERFLEQDGG